MSRKDLPLLALQCSNFTAYFSVVLLSRFYGQLWCSAGHYFVPDDHTFSDPKTLADLYCVSVQKRKYIVATSVAWSFCPCGGGLQKESGVFLIKQVRGQCVEVDGTLQGP